MEDEFLNVNYGYGFSLKKIESKYIDKKSFIQFLQDNIPQIYFDSMISECNPSSVKDYISALFRVEYHPDLGGEGGLAGVLQEALISKTGVDFISTSTVTGEQFILYQPKYPWEMKESDMGLTLEKLDEMMLSVLMEFMFSIPVDMFDFHTVFSGSGYLIDKIVDDSLYDLDL